jgi:hypothetical protein
MVFEKQLGIEEELNPSVYGIEAAKQEVVKVALPAQLDLSVPLQLDRTQK